jgi:hypothetical protein
VPGKPTTSSSASRMGRIIWTCAHSGAIGDNNCIVIIPGQETAPRLPPPPSFWLAHHSGLPRMCNAERAGWPLLSRAQCAGHLAQVSIPSLCQGWAVAPLSKVTENGPLAWSPLPQQCL